MLGQSKMADLASASSAAEDFSPPPLQREPSLPRYPVLHEHTRQIRLIEVLPAEDAQDIVQCKFQTISLGESLSYESLSYVWGDSQITKPITVDGLAVDVTANLENALRHIRDSTKSRLIWVDALCINQTNHPEKTRQIKMMGDIYQNSSQGLLWLGDFHSLGIDLEKAKAVKTFIQMLADTEVMAAIPPGHIPCFSSTCHDFYSHAFAGLECLLSSAWWTRIWTVQEVVLPPSSSLVFGQYSVSWQAFERAALSIIDHGWSCCEHMTEPVDMTSILNKWTSHCFSIAGIREEEQTPLSALWRFRDRAATDPRDKVLGVLGLIPSISFGADDKDFYDISVAELYNRLTISLIIHQESLIPLIGRSGEPANIPGLASWAIDWTTPPKSSAEWPWQFHSRFWNQCCQFAMSKACGELKLSMRASEDNAAILLDGMFVDKIVAIGETATPDTDQRLTIRNWRKLCPENGSYITGHSWDEVFYRIMIGDAIAEETDDWPTRPPRDNDRQHFDNYLIGNREEYRFSEKSIERNISIQRFFVTARGFIGVGSPVLNVDDEIWLLGGGHLPFILRSQNEDGNKSTENKTFTLVGDSYVHGLMYGEALVALDHAVETIRLL